ncbi:hypothetical protein CANARDRAFT_8108 [[Candida] arabinofermentans NRRL YB-2248]|uniref:Tetrapyrrole biosynthesis uroporphyrinogen III synthase domain-containing protein n=1 Tax=[Candida] arabinofermentans NRRL YB-2248 TaxID=983967 RepID=A0A1E4SZN0_9ASCO|nr:hypothetical protein CANARDRAFT_8108 [[Candida] arabinofermentans NRRL YB-2248]
MAKKIVLLKNRTTPVDQYHDIFESNDYNPQFLPLLKHSPLNKPEILQFLKSEEYINDYQALIVTSQRCIEVLDDLVHTLQEEKFEHIDTLLSKPSYTVGPTTAHFLAKLGFKDIRGGKDAGNGMILSDIIVNDPLFTNSNNKKILFLTGEIRRDIIPKRLKSENYQLLELVSYRTEPLDNIYERYIEAHNSMVEEDDNWVVFFSPQGTEEIIQYMKKSKRFFKLASIGPTTEEYLLKEGLTPHIVARKPDATSLFDSILNLSKSQE